MKYLYMILLVVLISACSTQPTPTSVAAPVSASSSTTSMANLASPTILPTAPPASAVNPATAFCQQQGGKSELRKDVQGNEFGVCVFANQSECDEWAFFRGECKSNSAPVQAKRITFPVGGTTASAQGSVAANGINSYVLRALAGQSMTVALSTTPDQAVLTIVGVDGVPLVTDHAGATSWSGKLPATQDYTISVRSSGGAANYTLQVTIPPLVASTPTPRRISFPTGGTTATVQGTVTTMTSMDNYILRVMVGQTMSVKLNTKPEQAIFTIVGADGQPLITDHADATQWSNPVPATQDYVITVLSRANTPTNYTLQITVPPLVAPTPVAKRITFAAGGTFTTVFGNLGAAALERYVISAQANQVMTVNATSPQQLAILVIYGADGTVLISDHADATSWSGRLPKTQDYIIDVLSRSNTLLAYSVHVTIPPR